MDQHRLSRVHWFIGQALLPEHFYAQEESLRGEVDRRFALSPAPQWGLGTLELEPYGLPTGVITIEKMTLVLRSGMVIDVPGNAKPATIKLKETGASVVPLYVHVLSESEVTKTTVGDADEEGIERIVHRLRLSTDPTSPTMIDAVKIAQFEADPEGLWQLSPDYLPPLVCLGRSAPIFEKQRIRLRAIIRALREILLTDIGKHYLAGESQSAARQALRAVFTFEQLLGDLEHGISPHPYEFFQALRALYVDVCMYAGMDPLQVDVWYNHEEFGECLAKFMVKLEEYIKAPREAPPYMAFAKTGSRWECALAQDARRARDVYLLVQKPQVSMKVDLTGTKLGSPTRIQTLHERALTGIPCKRIVNPPFHHDLSSNIDWYRLEPGDEWDYAIRERKLVMFDTAELSGSRLYLYYRPG